MRVQCKYKTMDPTPMVVAGEIVKEPAYGMAWVECMPQLTALGDDGDDAFEALNWRLQMIDWIQQQPECQH